VRRDVVGVGVGDDLVGGVCVGVLRVERAGAVRRRPPIRRATWAGIVPLRAANQPVPLRGRLDEEVYMYSDL
jgi:hypothetical protein